MWPAEQLLPRPVRQSLRGLRYLWRMRRGKAAVLAHLRAPQTEVPLPTFVQLRVTNVCDLRCKMCGQWGDTGVFREGHPELKVAGSASPLRDRLGVDRQLALADYERLLDELAPSDPVVTLFGGEPLLYPEIVPLVAAIKRRGLTATMITNGNRLAREAEALVEAGIDVVAISFDGHESLHDRIRGQQGSFARAAAGARALREARRRRGQVHPIVGGLLPITEHNAAELQRSLAGLRELPLDLVNVGLRWFVPPAEGAAHEAEMRQLFGIEATSWKGFSFEWPKNGSAPSLPGVVAELGRARRRRLWDGLAGRPWFTFTPDIDRSVVPDYFTRPQAPLGHELCPVAWYFAQVQPDGDVAFCGDFPDYVIGNVRKESFTSLWRGPRAVAFRERLAKAPLAICARCCGSFVYGRWQRDKRAPA